MHLSKPTKLILLFGAVAAVAVTAVGWANRSVSDTPDISAARAAIERKDYSAAVRVVQSQGPAEAKLYVRQMGLELGPVAAPVLMRLLDPKEEPREEVRAWSATGLNAAIPADKPKDAKDPAVAALVTSLSDDPSPEVRASAATTLGYTRTYQALENLFDALNDPKLNVRRAAGRAVAKITRLRLNYRPDDPEPKRLEQIRKLKLWWSNPDNVGLVGGYYDSGRFKSVYQKYSR